MKKKMRQYCENCKWWKAGDPAEKIGNMGVCTWALHNNAPTGLTRITMSMVSWEGANCATYTRATNHRIKKNNEATRP